MSKYVLKNPYVFEGTPKQIESYIVAKTLRRNKHPSRRFNPLTYVEKYVIIVHNRESSWDSLRENN